MTQSEPWTVRRLLEWTSSFFTRKQVDSPRLAAELLLAHVLNVPLQELDPKKMHTGPAFERME